MTTKPNKICQSCGMPLNKDPSFATEKDGSKNTEYCSYCYQNGKFVCDGINAKEMQDRVYKILVEKKFPRIIAWFFTRNLPNLRRWKK